MERLFYDQAYPLFDQIFCKLQCGFHKGFNTEQCLINLIEKCMYNSGPLTELFKAFDCIENQLLIAKLNAYGVDTNYLCFLASYLGARNNSEFGV